MAYSTEAEFRANVSIGTVANITKVNVDLRIIQADFKIAVDLSSLIDFNAIVVTPSYINILSQYKTAELCLVYMYGKKRKVEDNSDIEYWRGEYDMLIKSIVDGQVELVDGSDPVVSISSGQSTFSNTAKSGIKPALGSGKYGDFVSKADLVTNRPTD